MKILIGTPVHSSKDYAMERWLENVSKLEYPAELLMVDNSSNMGYMKMIRGYCKKYGMHPVRKLGQNPVSNGVKNYKIKHFEFNQGMVGNDVQERVAKAQEMIRQEVLARDYDAWFSWESDILIPVTALNKLIGILKGDIMVVVHNCWMRGHPSYSNFDMGCTLITRKCLEKHGFLPEAGLNFWQGEDDLYKLRALKGGDNYAEVEGLIDPIYHLAK